MATTALIAHIAAAKYAWQSTLYRQAQILAGHGVVVDRQTLARWMGGAAWMAKGLYDLQLKTMHGFERLFCDETPMPVLDPGRGRTKVCQFWAHATDDRAWKGPAPPAVAYVFAGGRGKQEIVAQLAGFEGVLQGRRLRRLRLAGGRCEDVWQDPAGVLPRSRAPQLREGAQGDAGSYTAVVRERGPHHANIACS